MSPRGGAALALFFVLPVQLSAASARGEELDCAQRWSILSPTPDACLRPIETDRPHLTESPYPVQAGRVQYESGLLLGDVFRRDGGRLYLFENVYKLGLVTGLDVELLHTHLRVADGALAFAAEVPLLLRAKVQVLEGDDGLWPTVSLVPIVTLPLDGQAAVEPGLLVFAAWELPLGMELEVNTGGTVLAELPLAGVSVLAASALTAPVWGPISAFVELYGVGPHRPEDPWDISAGGGLLWLAHRDVQLDTGAWIGLAGDVSPIIPFVGVSVRR